MNLYLEPGTYSVKELIPQEYNLQSVTGSITANNQSLTVVQGNSYQINFTNNFKTKGFMHAFGDVVNTGDMLGISRNNEIMNNKKSMLLEVYHNNKLINPEDFIGTKITDYE